MTGASNKRVSLAALIAGQGHQAQLIYRTRTRRAPGKDQRRGFTEMDYARLLDARLAVKNCSVSMEHSTLA